MRKQVFGRQLKRDTNERKALFKGLASSLVEYERIETTEEKAKAVKGYIEKLVTKAKKHDGAHLRSLLQPYLSQAAVVKMISDIAPRFATRPGGYIRIIKTRQRFSDNAKMVMMEWVEKSTQVKEPKAKAKASAAKKQTDKVEAEIVKSEKKQAKKTAPEAEKKAPAKTKTTKSATKKTSKEKTK